MPRVFTVYNCGTGFDRTHTEELIGHLATITQGVENRDWMINDGVGCSSVKFNRLTATPSEIARHDAALLPGSRNAVKRTQQGYTAMKGEAPKAVRFAKLRGIASGTGWEHNVAHAMDVIMANFYSVTPPEVINMAGWSRGAITCMMLAHELFLEPATRDIPVNIFAADPVAGPGNRKDVEKNTLSPNVKRYLGIMQQHEARQLFIPTVMKNHVSAAGDIKDKILHMPGAHNTGVIMLKSDVGLITTSLAHHFLTKHGTVLRDPIRLSPRDLVELYAKVRIQFKKYRKNQRFLLGNAQHLLGATLKMGYRKRKELEFKVENAGTAKDYFVNDHHIKQFRLVFPMIAQRLMGEAHNFRQAQLEYQRMSNLAPTTLRSLEELDELACV